MYGTTEDNLWVNGKITKCMAMVNLTDLMEENISDPTKKIKRKVLVYFSGNLKKTKLLKFI